MKNHLIVGDVHGCLNTLKGVLSNWKPKEQRLIFVGDIIDHGKYSPNTVAYIKDIQNKHKDTVILTGNHEQQFKKHCLKGFNEDWFRKSGEKTFSQYLINNREIQADAEWFATFPLYFETPTLLVSHAGVSYTDNPYDEDSVEGVVWHRNEIKKMDQLQVYGHTPKTDALYDINSNSVNIDTGAYKCNKLTAVLVNKDGSIDDLISHETHEEDIPEDSECFLID